MTPLNPTPATCQKRKGKLHCNFLSAALQELHKIVFSAVRSHLDQKLRCSKRKTALQHRKSCVAGKWRFPATLPCSFQAPTFRHPRFGPADQCTTDRDRWLLMISDRNSRDRLVLKLLQRVHSWETDFYHYWCWRVRAQHRQNSIRVRIFLKMLKISTTWLAVLVLNFGEISSAVPNCTGNISGSEMSTGNKVVTVGSKTLRGLLGNACHLFAQGEKRRTTGVCIYIYICCAVIIWAKFGLLRCYYLGQVCFLQNTVCQKTQ